MSRSQRSLLSKFKLGVLPLEIESGHWKDVPLEYRQCNMCKENLLGDKFHFTFWCDKLSDKRTNMFVEPHEKSEYCKTDKEKDMMKYIFQRECLKITGRHIEIMYQ